MPRNRARSPLKHRQPGRECYHLSLFITLQMLLQAIVLHKLILFMPVLYIVFGLPLDALVVIAFYSWGMSWQPKAEIHA